MSIESLRRRLSWKSSINTTVSTIAILVAGASGAGAQTAAQTAQAPAIEEVVVTGSRIVRDGYQAPTPLTVVGEEQIQAAAPKDIADYVNSLPTLANST